jgi:hypothetical protein
MRKSRKHSANGSKYSGSSTTRERDKSFSFCLDEYGDVIIAFYQISEICRHK